MERRVFKETLMAYYKLIYAVAAIGCGIFMWYKLVLVAVPLAVILLLITNRLVQGEYIMESETITLHRGRFLKDKTILINEIKSVSILNGLAAFKGNVRFEMGNEVVFLNPENPESFVSALQKRNQRLTI